MIFGALFHILGFLEIQVEGTRLERFVNLAVSNGIYVWDVRRRDGVLRLKMGLGAFRRVRPVARKAGCRVRIIRKRGWPFLLRRLVRRRVLLFGGAAVALCAYMLSSYVWFVQVRGLHQLPEERVGEALARLGLRPGVRKSALDFQRVAARLPLEVPEISWAGIHVRGTRVVVEVAERTVLGVRQRPEEVPADVVAAKDGLITRMLVLMGDGVVSEGQTVRRGQVLIRGTLLPYQGDLPKDSKVDLPPPRLVRARGIVMARVWYDIYIEKPLYPETVVRTGRSWTRRIIRLAGKNIVLSGFGKVPFSDYEREETVVRPAGWRNSKLPIELITFRYFDVVRRTETISQGEAVRRAQAEAKDRLFRQIPANARVLRESSQVLQGDNRMVGVHLFIETEEDIGRPRRIGGLGHSG